MRPNPKLAAAFLEPAEDAGTPPEFVFSGPASSGLVSSELALSSPFLCEIDLALAERARRGDATAWDLIIRRTRRSLFLLLRAGLPAREDAFDLLQETYLRAIRHLDQYRGQGTLLAWMRGIARRCVVDWIRTNRLRRRKRISWRDLSWDGTTPPALDEAALCSARDRLSRALERLTVREREVLILRGVEGLSHHEVARRLGCRDGTVRVVFARARRRARAFLAE